MKISIKKKMKIKSIWNGKMKCVKKKNIQNINYYTDKIIR